MMDIGLIHRREYEQENDRSVPVVIAEAPGRIHYLGEHGEPKAGLFLSSAIDRYMRVAVSARKDNSLRFFAADLGERKRTTLANLKYKREDRWANYIKVAIHIFAKLGYPAKGLNFTIAGNIPQHVGLASSSAIETAAAIALKGYFKVNITDRELLNHLSNSKAAFFGESGDSVDYLVAFSAKKDQFLVVDEAGFKVKRVKSPFAKHKLLVMDSRVPRMAVDEELKQRQEDTKKGLEIISRKRAGATFHNFNAGDLMESMGNLPEEIRRRSLHVVEEIARVNEAEELLKRADFPSFMKTISHSHESLRDLYEVSCPEVDWLVKRAQELDGVVAARMTGHGFGGCTYAFIRDDMAAEYKKRLEDYERIFGFRPIIYEMKIASGCKLVPELKIPAQKTAEEEAAEQAV